MMQCQAILDIGTSKVVCLIGSGGEGDKFDVYGVGVVEHEGIKKGKIIDAMSLRLAVKNAVDTAYDESKRRPRAVYIGVPGSFLQIVCRKGELNFQKSHTITEGDLDRLIESSLVNEPGPEGMEHIHGVVVNFKTDGASTNNVPIGQQVTDFSGIVSHVYMSDEYMNLMDGIMAECHLEVVRYIDASYAQSLMLIPERRRELDSVIVDVGAYETDVCVVRNEAPVFQRTICIGGAHFAQDLAICMNMPAALSEEIKRHHVFGLDYTGRKDAYKLDDGRMEDYDYETIQEIIEARATELSGLIVSALSDAPIDVKQDVPVYLTGGGFAMMRGSRDFLQTRINHPVQAEVPWMPRLNTPNYVSAYGLLNYACASTVFEGGDWKESRLVQGLINFFTK